MPLTGRKKEFAVVLDNISDGVLFIDNKGTIRIYNRALTDMLSIDKNLAGVQIFSLPIENPLRHGIFRAEQGFSGPYCWERKNCSGDNECLGKNSQCCRCWVFSSCKLYSSNQDKSCMECDQYKNVRRFLEKPKELEMNDKAISVMSSFIEYGDKDEIWEVIVFKDVTSEKIDAMCKLAGAMAHELRQPLQILTSSLTLLMDKFPGKAEIKEDYDTMKECCMRMNNIIEKINHLTKYKTKHYIQKLRILDIEGSVDGLGEDRD
ncbi:MAG: histidine kinase dimerization/phospho-acceptor domain-containing protein [Nitrospirota bacterium]